MLAIVSANPAAFLDGNVNGLMSGCVLALPAVDNISVDFLPVALDAVSKQNAAWMDNTDDEQRGFDSGRKWRTDLD